MIILSFAGEFFLVISRVRVTSERIHPSAYRLEQREREIDEFESSISPFKLVGYFLQWMMVGSNGVFFSPVYLWHARFSAERPTDRPFISLSSYAYHPVLSYVAYLLAVQWNGWKDGEGFSCPCSRLLDEVTLTRWWWLEMLFAICIIMQSNKLT